MKHEDAFPDIRLAAVNDRDQNDDGRYVLYWMTANRRTRYNAALQRAVEHANRLELPLVVLEALRVDYPWASDRFHRFVIEGMADNARAFRDSEVTYYPYVEPEPGAGKGLLAALAEDAALVVADDWPCFFLPRAVAAAGRELDVALEKVDACGVVPLRLPDETFTKAHSFRRWFQKNADLLFSWWPAAEPLEALAVRRRVRAPKEVRQGWTGAELGDITALVRSLPIDHEVRPTSVRGGPAAAAKRLEDFLERVDAYGDGRNHPDEDGSSGFSPYLHFGHLGAHEVVQAVLDREGWTRDDIPDAANGSRTGFWKCGAGAEAFLDEAIIWREVGLNMCAREDDYDRYESLPAWARTTLEEHAADERDREYDLEALAEARTHDEIWNAAQRELVREGRIHNYLRMLWGKKILEWTPSPRRALEVMIELNNRYALDGRDPNSYSGIFWVLGRYDRAWGPEREVYGKVRYMSSENTQRKLKMRNYLREYGRESGVIELASLS